MTALSPQVQDFQALHQKGRPFIMPNPWDVGSARILSGAGFPALATTSSGFALTLGRRDYKVTREEAIAHAAALADAVDCPVTADLENGFGLSPEDAAETIRRAGQSALAGGSIEDSTGDDAAPIMDETLAIERIAGAVEAARAAPGGFVLTARAEQCLYGSTDIDSVIRRLEKFAEAGADVLYAPGLPDLDAVRAVCASLEKPVNVLVMGPLADLTLEDFAEAGAARLSIGGAFAWNAYGALAAAADMLKNTHDFSALKGDRAAQSRAAKMLR